MLVGMPSSTDRIRRSVPVTPSTAGEVPLVLLILFEGIPSTVIDSAVFDHARSLSEAGAARFEIWSFCSSAALFRTSRAKLQEVQQRSGSKVRLLRGIRPAVPFSVALNARLIQFTLAQSGLRPSLIHARGDYVAAVCRLVRERNGIPLLWDCRGDCVSEAEARMTARKVPDFVRIPKLRREAQIRSMAKEACDAAVFVSRPLQNLIADDWEKPSSVIPCAASEDRFFFDPSLRACKRRELGYREDDIVYIFSGGLQDYQRFDLVVEHFNALARRQPTAKLLVLTPDKARAEEQLQGCDPAKFRVVHAAYSQVNDFLNVADIAFMLREKHQLNYVASPTKFAEYCLAGLLIVMDSSVPDAFATGRVLGNTVLPEELPASPVSDLRRAAIATQAISLVGRGMFSDKYARLYGTLPRTSASKPRWNAGSKAIAFAPSDIPSGHPNI
jgi:glycosyltransferase involved in cell wall biosynthesis